VKTLEEKRIRFSLTEMLAVITYICVALGLTVLLGSPALGLQFALLLIGWLLCHFARVRWAGVVLALLGIDILSLVAVNWAIYANWDLFDYKPHMLVGGAMVLVGLFVFIWPTDRQDASRRTQVFLAVVSFAFLVSWLVSVPMLGERAVQQRFARETAQNIAAQQRMVELIEEVREEIRRVPDEDELDNLLSEPLPEIVSFGYTPPISYRKTGPNSYELSFVLNWDIHMYNSTTPERGWFSFPF
jgi:hypothetical protein